MFVTTIASYAAGALLSHMKCLQRVEYVGNELKSVRTTYSQQQLLPTQLKAN